jgi:hypothetical protein
VRWPESGAAGYVDGTVQELVDASGPVVAEVHSEGRQVYVWVPFMEDPCAPAWGA